MEGVQQLTCEEKESLIHLLESGQQTLVLLALTMLESFKISDELIALLGLLATPENNDRMPEAEEILKKHLTREEIEILCEAAGLFFVSSHINVWQSEYIYTKVEDEVRQLLRAYFKCSVYFEKLLDCSSDFAEKFIEISQICWGFYSLPEADYFLTRSVTLKHHQTVHYYELKQFTKPEQLLQFQSHNGINYFYLAQLYKQMGKFEESLEAFHNFVELEPALLAYDEYKINPYYIDLKQYPPSTPSAYTEMAKIFLEIKKDFLKAREYFQKAIHLCPDSHQAPYGQLAQIYVLEKQFLQAYECFGHQADICSRSSAYKWEHYAIAEMYKKLGLFALEQLADAEKAMKNFKKTLQLQPQQVDVLELQIQIAFETYKDWWQVRYLCKKILKFHPKNQLALRYLNKIKNFLPY